MSLILNLCRRYDFVTLILYALFGAGLALHILNLSFFVLLIIALVRLVSKPNQAISLQETYQSYRWMQWAMASTLIALVLTQIGHEEINLSPYNPTARLATFVLLLWVMVNLSAAQLRSVQRAWVIGVMLCSAQLYFSPRIGTRPEIENWYIALAALLAVFSVLSLAWNERPGKLTLIAHMLGGFCGIYIIYVSQTRGVWMAMPLFILMAYVTFVQNTLSRKNIALLLVCMALFGSLFLNTDMVRNRVREAEQDIRIFHVDKNTESSVGTRLQLWNASWIMFKEHPLIGVGAGDNYKIALQEMVDRKLLPRYYNGAHSHNEILYSAVTMGIPGLVAMLLTYLVPGYYFGKMMLDRDRQTKAAAAMGMSVVGGFMIFGLVDVLFKYKETEVFYSVSCALLLAFIAKRKKQSLSDHVF